jgi:hypothetical protein
MSDWLCPYCGSPATIRDSAEVYHGKSYGLALICTRYPECDSFVGCHKDSGLPKGTLANAELRDWRKRAHAAFDPLWREHHWNRKEAYAWMSRALAIPPDDCHIGMFNVAQCKELCMAIDIRAAARSV